MIVYDVPEGWREHLPEGAVYIIPENWGAMRALAYFQLHGKVGDVVYAHPSHVDNWLSLPHHVTLRTWPDGEEITKREGVMPVRSGNDDPPLPLESVGRDEGAITIPWDEILSGDVISLDTETDSKGKPNPHRDKMLGLSIGWKEGEIYVPAEMVPIGFRSRLSKYAGRIVGHNSKYDAIVLRRGGWAVHFTDDTMLMAYMSGGILPAGLKPLTKQLLDREVQELKPLIQKYGSVAGIPEEILATYARADARNTWDVDAVLYKDVDVLYHELEIPMMHLLTDMEIRGWRVDKQSLSVVRCKMLEEQGVAERELQFFNIDKPTKNQYIAEVFLSIKPGLVLPKTPTGQWCTDADTLEEVDHPLAPPLLRWRFYNKRLTTWLRAMEDTDEYIHPSYRQAPISGRLSCAAPNVQNYPPDIRTCLVADPGDYLLAADCSQFELRIMAKMSGDPLLIQEFQEGIDIHQRNLEELGLPNRLTAKKIMFGISYGMDKHRMAEETGYSAPDCGKWIANVFAKYQRLRTHILEVHGLARIYKYTATMLGRRRYMAGTDDPQALGHELRALFNHTVQGTAADLMKSAQIFLTPLLASHGARVVAQIHDEFIISTPDPFKSYHALKETECHIQPWLEPVPFKLSVILGQNWGECK